MKVSSCVLDWRGGTKDWSRNQHTLTEHNTIPVRGVNGEAREFNGVDAYLDCGNDSSLNITDAITIEVWVKPSIDKPVAGILDKHRVNTYGVTIENGKIWFYTKGTSHSNWNSNVSVSTGVWSHLIARYDGSTKKIFLNGAEEVSIGSTGTISTSANIFKIGRTMTNEYFNGTISSVKIYNRALTPLEIWNNYVTMKPYIPLSESPVAIV